MLFKVLAIVIALSVSACSSWVYRIDIPQGNYLEQKDIDKLQMGMTKEQVKFVLGSPVVEDAFNVTSIQAQYSKYAALIEPYATSEIPGYTFLNNSSDFQIAVDQLNSHVTSRATVVSNYLD